MFHQLLETPYCSSLTNVNAEFSNHCISCQSLVNTKVYIFIQCFVFNVILAKKFPVTENSDVKIVEMGIYLGNYGVNKNEKLVQS